MQSAAQSVRHLFFCTNSRRAKLRPCKFHESGETFIQYTTTWGPESRPLFVSWFFLERLVGDLYTLKVLLCLLRQCPVCSLKVFTLRLRPYTTVFSIFIHSNFVQYLQVVLDPHILPIQYLLLYEKQITK